jgi:PAS domain S-box-containing protein
LLNEKNFDFIIAILAIVTILILIVVVFNRKKFINWFFVLFFGCIGGLFYYLRNFDENFRIIADVIYLFAFCLIFTVSYIDYNNTFPEKVISRKIFFIKTTSYLILTILIPIPLIIFIFGNNNNFLLILIISILLTIIFVSNVIYLQIIIKSFSITRLFFFLSIFSVLVGNIATFLSFFFSSLFWDLSYIFNILDYAFFTSCAITVLFEDELLKVSFDLTEKEKILQTFIELAPVGVSLFQKNKIAFVNSSLANISGYSKEEMKDWSVNDIVNQFSGKDRVIISKSIERTQNSFLNESNESYRASFYNKQGKQKWVDFYAKTTEFQGNPSNFIIVIDRSDQVILEEKFKLAFLNSPHPIVMIDGKTDKFLLFNDQFINTFGYQANELLNMGFNDLTLPEDLIQQSKNYNNVDIYQEGFKLRTNKRYRKKNGDLFDTVVSTSFIKLSSENFFFITQLVDLTYLNEIEYYKNINKSLEEANEELKSLNQLVSHDVKAPINAIAQLLKIIEQNQSKLPDEIFQIIEKINNKITFTSRLIKEILDYSGVGFFEDTLELVETKKVIEEINSVLTIPSKFNIEIQEKIPNLKISKIRIQQIFQNLVSNALKFNDKEFGKITIGANKLENGSYEFFVEDNGIGIPESEIGSLFQFFKTLNKSPDNTGLGLAIVKKIITHLGGKIEITSIYGFKTKISFVLPKKYIIVD